MPRRKNLVEVRHEPFLARSLLDIPHRGGGENKYSVLLSFEPPIMVGAFAFVLYGRYGRGSRLELRILRGLLRRGLSKYGIPSFAVMYPQSGVESLGRSSPALMHGILVSARSVESAAHSDLTSLIVGSESAEGRVS